MFDIHTHLWDTRCLPPSIRSYFPQREGGAQCLACSTAEDLISEMDQSGIEKAIVLALAFQPDLSQTTIRDINDYVIAQTSKSDRLAAFCTINPHDGRDSIPLLEEYILKKGCKGLKLHGSMQEFFACDRKLYPVYEWMQAYKKPIIFHTGGIGLKAYKDKYCALEQFDEIACDFPSLPIVLGHAGRFHYDSLAIILRKHRNCYAEISTNFSKNEGIAARPLERLWYTVLEWAGDSQQLLFGSDFPFYSQQKTMMHIEGLSDRESIQRQLEKNTQLFCEQYHIF